MKKKKKSKIAYLKAGNRDPFIYINLQLDILLSKLLVDFIKTKYSFED